jgi:hypothetical protein
VDAGPPDAGPDVVDAGALDAGAPDAGTAVGTLHVEAVDARMAPDAGGKAPKGVKATEPAADEPTDVPVKPKRNVKLRPPKETLGRLVRDCFEEAAKIHWGPQQVTLKGTLNEEDGEGQFEDGTVVRGSLHDARSNACFVRAMDEARFKFGDTESVDQEVTYTFDYVPGVKR